MEKPAQPGRNYMNYYKVGFATGLVSGSSFVELQVLLSYYLSKQEFLLTPAFDHLTHCSACPIEQRNTRNLYSGFCIQSVFIQYIRSLSLLYLYYLVFLPYQFLHLFQFYRLCLVQSLNGKINFNPQSACLDGIKSPLIFLYNWI